jgi:hypothetical protein
MASRLVYIVVEIGSDVEPGFRDKGKPDKARYRYGLIAYGTTPLRLHRRIEG